MAYYRPMECKGCGATTVRPTTITHTETFDNRVFTARLPAGRCPRCGDISVHCKALAAFELEVSANLAEHGPATGATFVYMRRALGLDAKVFAQWIRVSAETVSRWENNVREVNFAAWFVMGNLVLERAGRKVSSIDRLATLKVEEANKLTRGSTRRTTVQVRVDPAIASSRAHNGEEMWKPYATR